MGTSAEHAEVAGAFNLLLSVASLKNRKLADGLCGGNVLLNTQLGKGVIRECVASRLCTCLLPC